MYTTLERSVEGLNRFHGANLTLSSDVDHDTEMFGLHVQYNRLL